MNCTYCGVGLQHEKEFCIKQLQSQVKELEYTIEAQSSLGDEKIVKLEEEIQKLKDEYQAKHIVWEHAEEESARFRWVLEHIFSDKLECNECRADGTKSLAAHYEDLAGDVLKY